MGTTRRSVLKWAAASTAAGTLPAVGGCRASDPGARHAAPAREEGLAPIDLRPAGERGRASVGGWLEARYSFSFAAYRDPSHMGFRSLRVLNEDRIQPDGGFPMHPHRDMEIITYVLEGALRHRDTLGHGGVIEPGLVQRMSAGRGIRHSELNPSGSELTHLLQIWLLPERRGISPDYEQRMIPHDERRGGFRPIASRDGRDGSVAMHTDASILATVLSAGERTAYRLADGRHGWVQVARGQAVLNGRTLRAGDGAFTLEAGKLELEATSDAELLLFDLA